MNWIQTLLLLDPARCAVLDGSLFNIDYGVDHLAFTGANAVRLRLDTSGNGTRIAGATPTLTGEFCARIKTPMAAGAVFAFYASTTSTPHGDRDEIDLQFMRNKGADDGSVETDSFFKGVAGASVRVATGASKIAGPAMPYCISWIIGQKDTALNKAVWSANGVPIRTMSLANWTRPLLPIMSYWAVQNDNADLVDWAGRFSRATDLTTIVQQTKFNAQFNGKSSLLRTPVPKALQEPDAKPAGAILPSGTVALTGGGGLVDNAVKADTKMPFMSQPPAAESNSGDHVLPMLVVWSCVTMAVLNL